MRGYREDRDRLSFKAPGDRTRTKRCKLQHGKFQLARKNRFFTMNVPDIGTGAQRGCEISFLGGIKHLTRQTLAS